MNPEKKYKIFEKMNNGLIFAYILLLFTYPYRICI